MGVKLSEILQRYEKIKSLDTEKSKENFLSYVEEFNSAIDDLKFIELQDLKKLEKEALDKIDAYLSLTYKIQNKLQSTVHSDHNNYVELNKQIWQTNLETMTFNECVKWEKLWPPNQEEFKHFVSQIKQYINWQYPGLIFGAKDSSIIKEFVGFDPVYVVERYPEYFGLQKEKFTLSFSRRMRFYDLNSISNLPLNGIGTIVAFNEFNFLPWNYTTYAMSHFAKSLQPGGVLLFNYNNCNTSRGFKEFEDWSMMYTTPKMYIDLLRKYDLVPIHDYSSSSETFSFMIFKKSGSKKLIKKSPSFGFIKQQQTLNTDDHNDRLDKIRKLSTKLT